MGLISVFYILGLLSMTSCKDEVKLDPHIWIPLEVTATSYNSVNSQTQGVPNITAWGRPRE